MANYRKYDWPRIFETFEQSGLNQTQFCKEHQINSRYFSQKLGQHRRQQHTAGFCKVDVQSTVPPLILQVGQCQVHCPPSMPLDAIVHLVRTLA